MIKHNVPHIVSPVVIVSFVTLLLFFVVQKKSVQEHEEERWRYSYEEYNKDLFKIHHSDVTALLRTLGELERGETDRAIRDLETRLFIDLTGMAVIVRHIDDNKDEKNAMIESMRAIDEYAKRSHAFDRHPDLVFKTAKETLIRILKHENTE